MKYLYCAFNETRVEATYVSEREVRCTAPAGLLGYVDVEVTNNDVDYSESGVQYEYLDVQLVSAEPSLGVMSGGTEVLVMGENLWKPGTKGLFCRFGDSLHQRATWQSTSMIACTSPSYHDAAVVELVVINNEAISGSAVMWYFYEDPVVASIYPRVGGVDGGTVVQGFGSGRFYAARRMRG